jgi:aspartate dehydrogenase
MKVGLAGFGNVGKELTRRLNAGALREVELVAVCARDLEKAKAEAQAFTPPPRVVGLEDLPALCDVVIECATADSFPQIARAVLGAGKFLICISAAGVPNCPELLQLARVHGGRVRIASGTMPGLDIIRCAAEGTIRSVRLETRVKPESMARERYVLDRGFDFASHPPTKPVKVFEGTAGEAAASFPRHFNVAVSLSLAGIGFDRTSVEVWVDPEVPGAIHHIEVDGEEIGLSMTSRNRPSENPRTSRIVALSIIAALRCWNAPLTVGS